MKNQMITDLLGELPGKDQEKWKKEQRREEGRILKEIKDNMWKKWRGEPRGKERKILIPKEEEKLENNLKEIQKRIAEYRNIGGLTHTEGKLKSSREGSSPPPGACGESGHQT